MDSDFSAICPCSAEGLLTFEWGTGTELFLCELVRAESGQGDVNPYVSSVVWSAPSASHKTLAHALMPHQRDLVFSAQTGADEGRSRLRKFSSTVRQALDKEKRSPDADGGTSSIIALEHSLWHLLEVFFVDAAQSEGYIAEDLVSWLRSTGHTIDDLTGRPSLDSRMKTVLSGENLTSPGSMADDSGRVPSDTLPDYRPLVAHLVCVGRIQDALTLLLAHSAMSSPQQAYGPQHEIIDALYVLLRQMPTFRLSSSSPESGYASQGTGREFDNMSEFVQYRNQWQNQCRRLPDQCPDLFSSCRTTSPATFEGVATVLEILSGGEEEVTLVPLCSNWIELLVAHLVHLRPNAQARQHLKSLLTRCRQVKPEEVEEGGDAAASAILPMLGDLLEALIDLEVQRVVEVLSSSGAVSPWFLAHSYELMKVMPRAREVIERPLDLFGGDQVEYWRLMVAEMMASQPSTAWLAIDYLALCPVHGSEAAEIILESLPLEAGGGGLEGRERGGSSRRVHKILHSASVHGLSSTASTICRSVGARAWYSGRGGVGGRVREAAMWMLRAGDMRRLAAVLRPAVLDALLSSVALGKGSDGSVDVEDCSRGLEELESLLASLTSPQAAAAAVASITSQQAHIGTSQEVSHHTVTRFLRGFLRLRRSVETLATLHSNLLQTGEQGAQSQEVEEAALGAAREARQALMGDLLGSPDGNGCVVPEDIAMHLLSWLVVPLLDLVAKMGSSEECSAGVKGGLFSLFTTQDVQALIRWSLELDLVAKTNKVQLPAVALRAREIECIEVEGVKEVKICLARALTRSRVVV